MALATTTNSTAVTVTDNTIIVASATSLAPGRIIRMDDEYMQVGQGYVIASTTVPVLRGQQGSAVRAHGITTNVTHGLGTDFAVPPSQANVTTPVQPAFPLFSYGAAGAITPVQGIHIINGTSILAMTLAAPTKDQDGQCIYVSSNGKAAHTLTYTAGFGANTTSSDVLTFHASQTQAIQAIAANGVWVLVGVVAGAASVAGVGLG